jgi:elongation factor P
MLSPAIWAFFRERWTSKDNTSTSGCESSLECRFLLVRWDLRNPDSCYRVGEASKPLDCPLQTRYGGVLSPFRFSEKQPNFQPNRTELMPIANEIRKGMAINYNGDVAVVLETQHRTPGNLRAFVQMTLRSIRTGKTSDVRFTSSERLDVIPMMTKKMEFSYKDGEEYIFSDPDTYETVNVSAELVGDAKNFLVENAQVTVTFVDDKIAQVELPPSVILKVADAPEGVRGDSANNVQKTVTLETGITVQAPLFIKTGEKIKVDTRTGKYMERA